MAKVKVVIFLVFSLLRLKAGPVNCELPDYFVDLCAKNNSNISYDEYNTLKSTPCDCKESNHCIRKCCQFGFFHNFTRDDNKDGKCIRNASIKIYNYTVTLYEGTTKKLDTNIFLVGMLNCNNTDMTYQYFKMNNMDPNEKFYLQTNGSLYYPNSHRKYYNNDRFCVDEEDGLSVYLCYSPETKEKRVKRLVNSTGIVIFSLLFVISIKIF